MLDDGRYDAFVVDADVVDGHLRLELTIVAGEHKGEVLAVRAPTTLAADQDPIHLLGLPATLTVVEGEPGVTLDVDEG